MTKITFRDILVFFFFLVLIIFRSSDKSKKLPLDSSKKNGSKNSNQWIRGGNVRNLFRIIWIILSVIFFSFALWDFAFEARYFPCSENLPCWSLTEFSSLIFVLITIILIFLTHKVDEWRGGLGIKHAYKSTHRSVASESSVISAIVARQSIHIVIALGLVVAIVQNNKFLPDGAISWNEIITNYKLTVAWIVISFFSISAVLILISALCYDYACRFNWQDKYKNNLLKKGLKLDNRSWYGFVISLILSISLISPFLCIWINAIFGFRLLDYYFFPFPHKQDD